MTEEEAAAAGIANPSLLDLSFLVGAWDMTLSGASFLADPDEVLHGRAEVEPIEAGALLALRQHASPPNPPAATWIIGHDEAVDRYTVLYADGRGASRVYEMTVYDTHWRLWRNDPDFSQRFEATISADKTKIAGRWEKRQAGGDWKHDFNVTYSRLAKR